MSKVTAAIVVSVTALIAEAVEAAGAHKTLDDTLVFLHGENGYPCIRTPSLVRTSSGVLLAFAGTRCGRGDGCDPTSKFQQATHQDAVMKRSTDGGVTWGPLSVVHVANCSQHDHGAPVYDTVRNSTLFVFNDVVLLWTRSSDDGVTWTSPRPVTIGNYSATRVAPGRGLQLRSTNPVAPGRILFVSQLSINEGDIVYYTDDGGETWQVSETVVPECNEAQMVELPNGTILLNARDEVSKPSGGRRIAMSTDAGKTWTWREKLDDEFGGANCMGGMLAVGRGSPIYFSHPFERNASRANGTVFVSNDEGLSFHPMMTVGNGPSQNFAYSCLSEIDGHGGVGLLYETGDVECTPSSASCKIMFTPVVGG